MGIIGEATPNGWNSQVDLAYNPSTMKFEIASIALTGGKVFKFRIILGVLKFNLHLVM
jgi:hypothetical protein